MDQFLESSVKDYIGRANKIRVEITGVADGNPPKKNATYWGRAIKDIYKDSTGIFQEIELKPGDSFYENNIAFSYLRAHSFKKEIESSSKILQNSEYTIVALETEKRGSEYRKAGIYISLVNAVDWNVFKTGDISIDNFKKGLTN